MGSYTTCFTLNPLTSSRVSWHGRGRRFDPDQVHFPHEETHTPQAAMLAALSLGEGGVVSAVMRGAPRNWRQDHR